MKVNEVVPFLAVKDLAKSLAFYVGGLGFTKTDEWVDEDIPRWCRLKIGKAGLMLQQFPTEGPEARKYGDFKGEGVIFCFFCDDAVAFYRAVKSRKVHASEPTVGNGLWVTRVQDPDGYRLDFQSPTDVAEDTKLSAFKGS